MNGNMNWECFQQMLNVVLEAWRDLADEMYLDTRTLIKMNSLKNIEVCTSTGDRMTKSDSQRFDPVSSFIYY